MALVVSNPIVVVTEIPALPTRHQPRLRPADVDVIFSSLFSLKFESRSRKMIFSRRAADDERHHYQTMEAGHQRQTVQAVVLQRVAVQLVAGGSL